MFRHISAIVGRPRLVAQERELDRKIAEARAEIETLRKAELVVWQRITDQCKTALNRS